MYDDQFKIRLPSLYKIKENSKLSCSFKFFLSFEKFTDDTNSAQLRSYTPGHRYSFKDQRPFK